jgi:hypothetical protein
MALIQRPKTTSALNTPAGSKFVSQAPDAGHKNGFMKGSKRQISLTIPPALLVKIDAIADAQGLSRASWISMTLAHCIEEEGEKA